MGRPRDRRSAEGLLPRMEAIPRKNGFTYRYHPVGAKPINLGHDKLDACRQVLNLLGKADNQGSVQWVWEQYQKTAKWLKLAEGTRADYSQAAKELLKIFGTAPIGAIRSTAVARYVHIERAGSPRRANIEKALLSNLFKLGIKLGVCEVNATIGVEPHEEEARTEAPDPGVLKRFLDWLMEQTPQRRIIAMAARYASLAGNRQVEFLPLSWPQVDFKEMVIRVKRAKQRGKKRELIIERIAISPDLHALLLELKALNKDRDVDCLYVFPTRDNNPYSARGFKTLWQRCVLAAIEEKILRQEDRFTFHDLRAYYATVHKQVHGQLPDLHKDPGTTARIYDRNKVIDRASL